MASSSSLDVNQLYHSYVHTALMVAEQETQRDSSKEKPKDLQSQRIFVSSFCLFFDVLRVLDRWQNVGAD